MWSNVHVGNKIQRQSAIKPSTKIQNLTVRQEHALCICSVAQKVVVQYWFRFDRAIAKGQDILHLGVTMEPASEMPVMAGMQPTVPFIP